MIFFFGTRATKIKERQLKHTQCPFCSTQDSFRAVTYSKYFHFFWIPVIPLFKTHIAECLHCKKSYSYGEFTPEMRSSLEKENQLNPAKRPIWHGCGCLLLIVVFAVLFSLSIYGVYMRSNTTDIAKKDIRLQWLKEDLDKLTPLVQKEKDSISFSLKSCVDYDIIGGLDTENIEYFTRVYQDRLLVLLRIENIKKIKPEFRKNLIDVVEYCLEGIEGLTDVNKFYIGIEGKWNMVLIKTPTDTDLGGRFADQQKLLPFYGEEMILENPLQDTVTDEPVE